MKNALLYFTNVTKITILEIDSVSGQLVTVQTVNATMTKADIEEKVSFQKKHVLSEAADLICHRKDLCQAICRQVVYTMGY